MIHLLHYIDRNLPSLVPGVVRPMCQSDVWWSFIGPPAESDHIQRLHTPELYQTLQDQAGK